MNRYRQAALVYLVYGLIYLGGAVAFLTPDRKQTFFDFVPWWTFYLLGLVFVLLFPVLVWREHVWFTRVLAPFPAIKAMSLAWRQGQLQDATLGTTLYNGSFGLVAMAAAIALAYASWGPAPDGDVKPRTDVGP